MRVKWSFGSYEMSNLIRLHIFEFSSINRWSFIPFCKYQKLNAALEKLYAIDLGKSKISLRIEEIDRSDVMYFITHINLKVELTV